MWVTGNQPEQNQVLPRPALLPNVPLGCILEHLFVFVKRLDLGPGNWDLVTSLSKGA